MNSSKILIERVFLCSIDSAKEYVDYNEHILDPDGEMAQFMLQLFSRNYDNTSAKKSYFQPDSFIASILPDEVDAFDAFVDVVADRMHTLIQDAVDLPSGSGIFIWATVYDQPIIAFFKLNFQKRFGCVVDGGQVSWQQVGRLLPTHTQKDYDFFYINILDRKVWMSDNICHIGNETFNYMSDKILELQLIKSEKQAVSEIETAVLDTIRECYKNDAPQKVFEYRQSVVDEVEDYGKITPKKVEEVIFADNAAAKERYQEKLEKMDIPEDKAVSVGSKTKRQLKKKQKIVTENGIEIWVPIEYLEDKSVFDYRQDPEGNVSIVIKDIGGNVK